MAHRRRGHRPLPRCSRCSTADEPNPLELFQIWLNLPADDKLVDPYFTMLWDDDIPRLVATDDAGRTTEVTVIAGELAGLTPPPPPPNSWASRPEADVAIWHLRLEPGARVDAAAGRRAPTRSARSTSSTAIGFAIDGTTVGADTGRGACASTSRRRSTAGADGAEVLVLQGRPIGEPVAQYGPFVMNERGRDRAGLRRLPRDRLRRLAVAVRRPRARRATQGRFARHADGRVEEVEPVTTRPGS